MVSIYPILQELYQPRKSHSKPAFKSILLSINRGRGPPRAKRVFSPVLHVAHVVKYITSQSISACYKRTESCFARQDVESGSRTLAKNTFQPVPSLKLQYLHVHFPLGNCSAGNIHHSMVHRVWP